MWKTPRTLLVAGGALVVGLGVGAAVVPAVAAQDPVLTPDQQSTLSQQAQAYRDCLEQNGATLPEKPADGSRPQITDAQREALKAAHDACESQRPDRPELSDAQKAQLEAQMQQHRECMTNALSSSGITLPERPTPSADGTRPAPGTRPQLTDEQRAAIEQARTACADLAPNLGVDGGGFGFGHGPGGRGPGGPGGPGMRGGANAPAASGSAI